MVLRSQDPAFDLDEPRVPQTPPPKSSNHPKPPSSIEKSRARQGEDSYFLFDFAMIKTIQDGEPVYDIFGYRIKHQDAYIPIALET